MRDTVAGAVGVMVIVASATDRHEQALEIRSSGYWVKGVGTGTLTPRFTAAAGTHGNMKFVSSPLQGGNPRALSVGVERLLTLTEVVTVWVTVVVL